MEKDIIYVLRTCDKNSTNLCWPENNCVETDWYSYHSGFQWPENGYVETHDWDPDHICGQGLYAFPRGIGDGHLATWSKDVKWLVIKVYKNEGYTEFTTMCKFRKGMIIYCGNMKEATTILYRKYGMLPIIGGYITVGDRETAIAGYSGVATAGHEGTAKTGNFGISKSGFKGISMTGNYGEAIVGTEGTAMAGEGGIIQIRYINGGRYRFAIGYVGEGGVKSNTKYKCNNNGDLIEVGVSNVLNRGGLILN